VGGKDVNTYIWWCAYYIALGYPHSKIYQVLTQKHHFKLGEYETFKKHFSILFGSIMDARKQFVDPIKQALETEGYSLAEINKLYPLSRSIDKSYFLYLTTSGLSLVEIARILGYEESRIGRIAHKIIDEQYPFLPIYKFSSIDRKSGPSFEDLQYYLMGEVILSYIYQGTPRKDLPGKFRIKENPSGIGLEMVDRVCERVLGARYTKLLEISQEAILRAAILATNPQTLSDIANFPGFWMPYGTAQGKIIQFFQDNKLVQAVKNRGIKLSAIEIAKIATIGNLLLFYYQAGYSDQQILERLGSDYSITDINYLTKLIWNLKPETARWSALHGFLEDFVSF
jgi:hypothetical protein